MKKYYQNRAGWRVPCFLSIVMLLISKLLGTNFLYIHYYLYSVAVLIFFQCLFKVMEFDNDGITFYYGFLNNIKKNIRWDDISKITLSYHEYVVGGSAAIPIKKIEKYPCVFFVLKKDERGFNRFETKNYVFEKNGIVLKRVLSQKHQLLINELNLFASEKLELEVSTDMKRSRSFFFDLFLLIVTMIIMGMNIL